MAKKQSKQENEAPMQAQEPVAEYRRAKPMDLKSTYQTEGLNAAQLQFLQTLRFVKTEEELNELREIVSDFYIKRLQKEADRLWDQGVLGDFLLNEHLRTPYKY